jgi:hypothetical protein
MGKLDGTLADITHRRRHLTAPQPDWAAFNNEMLSDDPNIPIVTLYRALWESKQFKLLIVSGREEDYRGATETWLSQHQLSHHGLYLRASKDYRADYLIKQEILQEILAADHDILFTVDDRQQVVDMWREQGLTCLQCAVGDF